MKLIASTLTAAALALLASATFAAEATSTRPARPAGGRGNGTKPDAATVVTHMSTAYSQVAPYDLNVNGLLEASEQEQLADAITAGTLTLTPPPGRTPPADFTPPPEHVAARAAEMYASVAVYDANVDGVLSADEQAALKTAIESGKLARPGKGPQGGKGGRGGAGGRVAE